MSSSPSNIVRLIDEPHVTLSIENVSGRRIRYRADYIGGNSILGPAFTLCEGSGVEALLERIMALDALLCSPDEVDAVIFDSTFKESFVADTTFIEMHFFYDFLRPDFVCAHVFMRVEDERKTEFAMVGRKTEFAMVGVLVLLSKGFSASFPDALEFLAALE